MAISLYDLSVASFLQTLGGVAGFLQRGLDHCRDNNTDPSEIVETRLYGDMLPFRFQIVSVAHHSLGAIEGVQRGQFAPPGETPPHDTGRISRCRFDAGPIYGAAVWLNRYGKYWQAQFSEVAVAAFLTDRDKATVFKPGLPLCVPKTGPY